MDGVDQYAFAGKRVCDLDLCTLDLRKLSSSWPMCTKYLWNVLVQLPSVVEDLSSLLQFCGHHLRTHDLENLMSSCPDCRKYFVKFWFKSFEASGDIEFIRFVCLSLPGLDV